MGVFFFYTASIVLYVNNSMQIGCCWFDADKGTLKHCGSHKSWTLSFVEQATLTTLLAQRGRVVSRMQLVQAAKLPPEQIFLLEQAVENIKQYLGPEHAGLLEQIDREGFLLHNRIISRKPMPLSPKGRTLWRHYCWMLFLIILALWFISSRVGPLNYLEVPDKVMVVSHPSGEQVFLRFYGDHQTLTSMAGFAAGIEAWIKRCPDSRWRTVTVSLCDETKAISLIARGENMDGDHIKAYKLTMAQMTACSPEYAWLQEALDCE